jgi:hypothetical protein
MIRPFGGRAHARPGSVCLRQEQPHGPACLLEGLPLRVQSRLIRPPRARSAFRSTGSIKRAASATKAAAAPVFAKIDEARHRARDPAASNRKTSFEYDRKAYERRNLVERRVSRRTDRNPLR